MDSIDDDYIWQRRIHHGTRCRRGEVPYPLSVGIGLEFNATLERREKLDLSLLTNGVMLEIFDFAKTVTKSEKFFLFEMLQFNFDLGVAKDNHALSYKYMTRIHAKIKLLKDQIKLKQRWREAFTLTDISSSLGSLGRGVAARYRHTRNTVAASSLLTDGSRKCQEAEGGRAVGSVFDLKMVLGATKRLSDAYPFCSELGVALAIGPDDSSRQKLNLSQLTNGVMLELLDFSHLLCGSHGHMVMDLVKQNFGVQLDRLNIHRQLFTLMERKCALLQHGSTDRFCLEAFKVQPSKSRQSSRKRKVCEANGKDLERVMSRKGKAALNTNSEETGDGDLSSMCPVDILAEAQLFMEARGESLQAEGGLPPAPHQNDGSDAQLLNCRPVQPAVSDVFSEDKTLDTKVKTERQRLWARRAPRSKQILTVQKVGDMFARCRRIALDFNVGSGNQQNLQLSVLTNGVMLEVHRFAVAMRKSLCSFLMDVLNRNFKLGQGELLERHFYYYLLTKEKSLQNHPDRKDLDFLSTSFHFPEVYNLVNVHSHLETGPEFEREQQMASDTRQQNTGNPHWFCKKLGLDLWSTDARPEGHKLDLTVLTTGAVLEIFSFIRELCGSVHEVVNNVLEHNFCLDLQNPNSQASQGIQRWYTLHSNIMKRQSPSARMDRWSNTAVYSQELQNSGGFLDEARRKQETFPAEEVVAANGFHTCKEVGLQLDVASRPKTKSKLHLGVLTRGVLLEVHRYVEQQCLRYVPSLYEILDYNFDLSSQKHRKVEFAWSIASQVIAMAAKNTKNGNYLNKVFELPFEPAQPAPPVCKDEQEDDVIWPKPYDDDIVFVRELKPVDIEVEIE